MTTSNPSRFLATTAGDFALTRDKYLGSVVEAFRDESILFDGMLNVIDRKSLTGTNSTQFFMMADLPESEEHTPGTELLGQQYEMTEGTIQFDSILASHADVPLDQYLQSPVEIIGKLGPKQGRRIARDYDQRLFNLGVNTARASASYKNGLVVHNGGNRVTNSAATVATRYTVDATGAANFRKDCAQLAQNMDEDFVPEDGRNMLITPYIRRVLSQDTTIFDIRYNNNSNPENELNQRKIGVIEGFDIIVAKGRMPSTNVTRYTQSKYNGNFLVTGTGEPVALALCGARDGMAAMGSITAQDLTAVIQEDHRRNTTFMKAQILMGAGQLHPWCAGSIEVVP